MDVTGGTLNVLNGSIRMGWDSSSILNISGSEGSTSGGVVNAKGIRFLKSSDASDSDTLTLSSGGRLNVGTLGIANSGAYDTKCAVKLNGGTLGALDAAGWTLQNVDTTIGHITIDTNVWDAATGATATGDAAGSANISLLGELTAAEGGMNITLAGNGSITIDHTLHGTVTLAENAEARLYYDASNLNNYDKVLSGIGSTGASGFLQGYQIIGAGSSVAVYAVGSDTAVTLTNGAVMLDAATELYVRDELAYDGTTMGSATHYYIEEGGVFDFTGYSLGTETDSTNDETLIDIMNKMSGAGTVKLASGALIQTKGKRDNVNLSTNYKVAGDASASLTLTSWKYDGMSNWRTWLVGEGGSITVGDNGEGTLNILAGQRLSIEDGGQVSVGTLKLGHDETSDNPGSLVMSGSGSKLTVGGIVMQNGITGSVLNTVEITGGTLKVTGTNAITYNADNVMTAVTLGGSDAASSVLLQTGTTTGWVMSKQANAASTFNVGYVTIDGTNTQSITFNGATLTGAITNNASLILGEDVVWNSGATVSNNGTLQINKGTGDLVLNNIVDVNAGTYRRAVVTNTAAGNLIIVNTGNKSLSGDITISNGGKVTLKGGTFGTADAAITNNIAAENSTTLVLDGVVAYLNKAGDTDQILDINTELTNGSVMHMLADDRLNWGGSYTTTVGLNSLLDVGSTRQSLSGNTLKLAGGTIYGTGGTYPTGNYTAGLDYHESGTITVTENSLIATAVASRETEDVVTLDVAANKTLTIGSYTAGDTTNTGSFVGAGKFDKTGNGTLLYKGAEFTNGLTISGGVFEYYLENDCTHSGRISGSGTFRKSGSGTLTLDSSNTSVTTLNVAGGKLVYNSTTDTTHTISGASGTFFEKTGSGSLTANTDNYSGEILVSAGTLKNSTETGNSQKVTVANGATVDLNGKAAYYNLTLQEGATLTNSDTSGSTTSTGTNKKQLHTITLEGDAKVTGSNQLGMVGSGHTTSNLYLNGNTLTKEGTNTFHLFNTTVHSAGLIQINGGTVKADGNTSGTLNITKASLAIDGGTFQLGHRSQSIQELTLTSGSLTIGSGLTLTALGDVTMSSGTVSGNLCLSGTITLTGDGTNTVNLSSAVLSGTSLSGFTQLESARPTTSGLQALTYQLWSGTGSVTSTQTSVSVGGVSYAMDAATGTFTTDGTVYYVVEGGTISAGGDSAAEGTASATSFVVDGTLNIAGNASDSLTTVGILTTTTGTGTMVLQTGATLGNGTATQFKGDMQIDSGSKLALGSDAVGGDTSAATVDVSTLRSVKLNGGELYIRGVQATLNEVESVADSTGSQLTVYDMTNAAHAVSIGTLTLNAALQLNAPWKSTINVDNLTGSGALTVNRTYSDNNSGDTTTLNINSLDGFTGSMTVGTSGKTTNLSISTGAVKDGVSFGGITTTAVNNFEFNVQTNTTVGTLNLDGSTADTISVEAGKTLTVSTALSGLSGSLTLGEGAVLDLTGLNVGIADSTAPFVMVNNAARGEGVVKYQGYDLPKDDTAEHKWRVSLRGDSALTLNTDVEVLNGIAFNTYNTTDKHIYSNRNLTVGGELRLESQARLTVSAGSVSAGTIGLGHAVQGNPGHLELTGGTITTGGITKTNSDEAGNTLTMSGGMLEITSASGIASGIQTTITGGTLKASGDASWGITGASIGGAVIETGSGSISLAGGTLTNKLNNTAGNLALSGEFNVVSAGYADKVSTLNATSNGYASTSTVYTLVSDASKLSGADTVTWKMDGAAAAGNDTLSYADGALTHVSEGTEYYVVGSDISYSGIGKINAKGEALTALVLNGKGVNLDAALGEGVKIKVQKQGESIVAIGSGLTLNSSQVESTATQKLKLHGSGTYTLASGAFSLGNSVVLGAETSGWTGTVKVSNVTYRDLLTELNKLGNASSTVSVSDAVGYFDTTDDDGNAFNTNLYLEEGDAITLTNGNSVSDSYPGRKVLINGDVSGEGNIVVTQSANPNTTCVFNYEFAGDVSDWTGTLSNKVTKSGFTIGVAFSGTENSAEGNNIIKANVLNEGSGESHLTFSGSKKHEMKGQVDVNVLNVNMSTDFSNTVQVDDELVVANGQTATITSDSNSITAGNVNISQQNATMSNVTVAGSTISATNTTDGAKGSISNANVALAQLAEDATFTIEDMTLTNTTITAATPTTQVNFSNVTVAGATVLRNMQASMTGANVAAGGSEGVKGVFTASTSLLSGITLANTDAVGSTIVVDLGDLSCAAPMGPGKYDLSITLSGFNMQDYTQGIVFAADSWLGQLLTAQGATAYVSGAVETPASVSEGGSTGGVSVSYSAATGSNVGTVITITGLNVPEPATSTLSLLALAALAARRCRK